MASCPPGNYPVNRHVNGRALAPAQQPRGADSRLLIGEAAAPNLGQLRGSHEGVRVTSPDYRRVAVEAPGWGTNHAS
jgi:hypothetical protein